jgi:hypothetical protein
MNRRPRGATGKPHPGGGTKFRTKGGALDADPACGALPDGDRVTNCVTTGAVSGGQQWTATDVVGDVARHDALAPACCDLTGSQGVTGSSPVSSTDRTIARTGGDGGLGGVVDDECAIWPGDLDHGDDFSVVVDADLMDEGFDGSFPLAGGSLGEGVGEVGAELVEGVRGWGWLWRLSVRSSRRALSCSTLWRRPLRRGRRWRRPWCRFECLVVAVDGGLGGVDLGGEGVDFGVSVGGVGGDADSGAAGAAVAVAAEAGVVVVGARAAGGGGAAVLTAAVGADDQAR